MKSLCFGTLLLLLTTFSSAGTQIIMQSETGDYIGQGKNYDLTDVDGTISINATDSSVSINYRSLDQSEYFYWDFVAPEDLTIDKGGYLHAQRHPFQGPLSPGISVTGNGRGCNTASGHFYVYEYDLTNESPVIAMDFTQYCGNSTAALTGSVRINSSIPTPTEQPLSVIDSVRHVLEGSTVNLDGSYSLPEPSNMSSYYWEQLGGPSAVISDPNNAISIVTLPVDVELGGEFIILKLTVTNEFGVSDSSTKEILVKSISDPQTFFVMESESGDYIGQGQNWYFDDTTANITISRNYDNGVSVNIDGDSYWSANFAAANDIQLEVGSYDYATRFPFQGSGAAGLSIYGDGRGCNNLFGSFEVTSLLWDNNNPLSFSANFEQRCEQVDAPVLSGEIRYNSVHPGIPVSNAGSDIIVIEGSSGNLTSNASYDNDGAIVSYDWISENNELVLSDTSSADISFNTPILAEGIESKDFLVKLIVRDNEGYKSVDEVIVTVVSSNAKPVAVDDFISVKKRKSITFYPLTNDYDTDGSIDLSSIVITRQPKSGTLSVSSDGNVIYKHTDNTRGTDSFEYYVMDNDGEASNIATVNITFKKRW